MSTTAQTYYTTEALHGNYQFYTLDNIIDDILVKANLNHDSLIKNKPLPLIQLAAKNGVSELSIDMANDILALELEIGDDLRFIFPQNYLDWVRISLVNSNGDLQPLNENTTNNRAVTYLQAHDYSILFSGDGDVLEADGNNAYNKPFTKRVIPFYHNTAKFQLDTSKLSKYGEFIVDKQRGCFVFDSSLARKNIVLEYISDGLDLENLKGEDVNVHKYFRDPLIRFIEWELVNYDVNVPEREKMRRERLFRGARQKAFARFADIKLMEVSKAFRASLKWVRT